MKPNKKPGTSEVIEALRQFRHVFFAAGSFSMACNVLMLVPAIYMLQLYDRVLASMNVTTLFMLTVIVVGLYILLGVLEAVRAKTLIRMGNELDAKLNGRVFRATYESYLKQGNGNAQQALSDFTNIRQFTTGQGVIAFFDAPWTPIYLIILFLFHWQIGVLALVGACILIVLTIISEISTKEPLGEANKIAIRANAQAASNLRNAEVIESMGMLEQIRQRWLGMHREMLGYQTLASERAAIISSTTKVLRLALQSLVLGLGAWLVIQNELTAGMMIAGSILMGRALAPVEMLIGTWKGFIATRNAHGRISELLHTFPERDEPLSLPPPKGSLQLEAVHGGPPGAKKPIVSNVSLELPQGQVLGIVGPSGSGKSTLVRLLVGVWGTMSGKVRLDGADVFTWNKNELGPHVGYLPQDIELFAGTIAENIARFGQVDAGRVVAAAQLAGVHEIILRLPDGYDTVIGEGGMNLSGGQRQRVALARALYGDPVLVVLDEPNSNLDDAGEQALIECLGALKSRGVTVVVVTHRTSVLSVIDRMLVMKDGLVSLYGPREEVLAALRGAATQAGSATGVRPLRGPN
ncbi:MAG: type I secretion system permease/ATPase [Rhodocyclaceae bacterium]